MIRIVTRERCEIGDNWPIPKEPGRPLESGFYWMSWPGTGVLTVGQWSEDIGRWVVSYLGHLAEPEELAHLHYIGRIVPEPIFTRTRQRKS